MSIGSFARQLENFPLMSLSSASNDPVMDKIQNAKFNVTNLAKIQVPSFRLYTNPKDTQSKAVNNEKEIKSQIAEVVKSIKDEIKNDSSGKKTAAPVTNTVTQENLNEGYFSPRSAEISGKKDRETIMMAMEHYSDSTPASHKIVENIPPASNNDLNEISESSLYASMSLQGIEKLLLRNNQEAYQLNMGMRNVNEVNQSLALIKRNGYAANDANFKIFREMGMDLEPQLREGPINRISGPIPA